MPYIGVQPSTSFQTLAKQDFTTSATTSYTLSQSVSSANDIALFINNVRQEPTFAYSASGTALTLTAATSSSDDMYCIYLGKAISTIGPSSGSVGIGNLSATGTKDSTTFLRGDNTFAVPTDNGKVLQIQQTTKLDIVSTTTIAFHDITGLSVDITPSSTSSKILCFYNVCIGNSSTSNDAIRLMRDSTSIFENSGTTQVQTNFVGYNSSGEAKTENIIFLDSPNTTSQITYKVQWSRQTGTLYLNRRGSDTAHGAPSSICVMEISG